ncbi:hypothetical protein K491DRAFT_631167 [Lophiostoma macrostomum CBS 122681]|uniref:TPR-like protein n=1 Tax=Lophiostoma macrostomum CBS 122681 TaxID=1314788 RepID=A0A6A6T8J4_9PLEO|nr:hypothetical protein K491DRAFT_631167 [Lophiostoma macrostomum CBS 122681]
MLERASTCLESGGRHLLQCPKRGLRSRRMLHSSFWHHGAIDLSLPAWWASPSIPGRLSGDDQSRGCDGLLLDFLYPEKTLALMQTITKYGADSLKARRKQSSRANAVRQFSTTPWQRQRIGSDVLDPEEHAREQSLEREMQQHLYRSTANAALEALLASDEQNKQELAMRLYDAIPESGATSQLRADLLEYVESAPAKSYASRVVSIFESLPEDDRRASSYRIATSAYLALGMVGSSVQLYETAASRNISGDLGVDMILERTVKDNQWELCLRVYRGFVNSRSTETIRSYAFYQKSDRRENESMLAWRKAAKIPYLRGNLESFLFHVKQFRHELADSPKSWKAVRHFTFGLAAEAMEQILTRGPIDEQFVWDFFVSFFEALRALEIPAQSLYEYSIRRILHIERYRLYNNQDSIWHGLYRMYWRQCRTKELPGRPSKELYRQLILQAGHLGSESHVARFLKDLRRFYPDEPIPDHTLEYLVRFYAQHGQADIFHELFDEFAHSYESRLDLRILMLLPFTYARRVDVQGAERQFRRITEEFSKTPDIACWNVLLLAYARDDDLDGALACFNRILSAGCTPDTYTYGPMLELCSARGDIEAFETIYSRAEQLGIDVRTDGWARSGYVQACLRTDDIEGAEATARAMLKSHRGGMLRDKAGALGSSLTHVWNMLIQHYALEKDVMTCRRLYREMIDNEIPLDTWTYASLMRGLIEVSQTNAAFKILRSTMRMNNLQVHAFHYTIVMTGFLREGQYPLAEWAYKHMLTKKIPQTAASRLASLEVLGALEMRSLRQKRDYDPRTRLKEVEEALREVLVTDYKSEVADRQPHHSMQIDSRRNVPEGYFGFIIMLYGTRRAFDICKELFEAATIARQEEVDYRPPITLLTAMMEVHLKAKEYDEVAKCWELAKQQADKLVKTVEQVVQPPPPQPEFDSLLDPAVMQSFEDARIAKNRRQVLTMPTRIYIRSLAAQEDPNALGRAQRAIRSLLTSGFVLDNMTWNDFIQMQARRGAVVDAFSTCEMYLMPNFPGWRDLNPFYIRKTIPGFNWMEVRHTDITQRTIMPRYKTLVVLARVYAQIRRDEADGIGYNPHRGDWDREILERMCPMTVNAIITMPRTGDKWQQRILKGML